MPAITERTHFGPPPKRNAVTIVVVVENKSLPAVLHEEVVISSAWPVDENLIRQEFDTIVKDLLAASGVRAVQ